MRSTIIGLSIALSYGLVSASMAFINKTVLTYYNFDFPYFLVTCQMALSIVVLETTRLLRNTNMQPYTLERGLSFLLPSVLYAVNAVLGLSALSGMNIPMYSVIKRCTPVVILLLDSVLLQKAVPSVATISSVCMITLGCLLGGYGDLAFDPKAYTFGLLSVLVQAGYLLLVQRLGTKLGAEETLHINSYNTLPLLLTCTVLNGEFNAALEKFDASDPGFVAAFVMVITVGFLLNYLLFLCTTYNSALTTSITGSLKAILQTAVGLFTFGGISLNVFSVLGITINLSGGIIYTLTKYMANKIRVEQTQKEENDV